MNPPKPLNMMDPIIEGVDAYTEETFGCYAPRFEDEEESCDHFPEPRRASRTLGDYVIHRKSEAFAEDISVITEETSISGHGTDTEIESWEMVTDISNDEDSRFSDFSILNSIADSSLNENSG